MDNRLYNIKPASCCKQEQDSDCGITINLSEEPNSEYLLKSEAFCLFQRKGQYALISQLPDTTQFVKKGYADRTYLTEDALDILDQYVTIAYLDENIHDIVESEVESTTYSKNQIDTALSSKADISSLADVATSGSYGDLQNTPTNVSQFTNDAGYLTEHQSLANYVQKSSTVGLLKNDGTVDTTQYLTQHQDISGKADKSEMSVEPGTGANADKTTITLKQGTSATVLTAHQDISGKANTADLATVATTGSYNSLSDKPTIPTVPTNVSVFNNDAGYLTTHQDISGKEDKTSVQGFSSSTLTPALNYIYNLSSSSISSIDITLNTESNSVAGCTIIYIATDSSTPTISFTGTGTKRFQSKLKFEASSMYEINCLWTGVLWIIAANKLSTVMGD